MKQTFNVKMRAARSTPGTFLYEAENKMDAQVKNVYIQRTAFADPTPPSELTVTISYDDGKAGKS